MCMHVSIIKDIFPFKKEIHRHARLKYLVCLAIGVLHFTTTLQPIPQNPTFNCFILPPLQFDTSLLLLSIPFYVQSLIFFFFFLRAPYTLLCLSVCMYKYVCKSFQRIFNIWRPLLRQPWAAIGCTKNGQPIRVTVHSDLLHRWAALLHAGEGLQ